MIYKLLWNIRLWFTGIVLIVMYPFVLLWMVLVDIPIQWAKDFEEKKEGIK